MNLGFDGEKYRAASADQREWGSKLIAELKLRGSEEILDLGCGDGAPTAQLAHESAFDVVFSSATRHWIRDQVNLLHRIFQALRTGGLLRFSVAAEGHCADRQ